MKILQLEAFTRQRALSLPHRVSMLLNLRKGSIGDELDRFFLETSLEIIPIWRSSHQCGYCCEVFFKFKVS